MATLKTTALTGGKNLFLYFFLLLFVLIFAFPFYYVFVLATLKNTELFTTPPAVFFSTNFVENFQELLGKLNYLRNYFNSVSIAGLATAGTIFFCTMGGFAFAKYNFRGKTALFSLMIATLAIPPFLNIIPFFKMMVFFRWYNTWLPLIVPGVANAFGIFLMSQFIRGTISDDLMDACRIDGLNEFGTLWHIVFPMSRAGISVLGIVTFIGSWNNFLGALILLPDIDRTTIPVALSTLSGRQQGNFGGLFVGTALALLPLIIVFILFSKRIIADISAGSVKG